MAYLVEISNNGNAIFNVKARENKFEIEPMGKGLAPAEVLLASLGSCVGLYTKRYLEGARINNTGFEIKIESDFCKDAPIRLKEVKVYLNLKDVAIDEVRRKSLLEFVKKCPIGHTLEYNCEIAINLV